jgi:hypothetical protein
MTGDQLPSGDFSELRKPNEGILKTSQDSVGSGV